MNTIYNVNTAAPGDGFNTFNYSATAYRAEGTVVTLSRENARALTPAEDPDQYFRPAGRLKEASYLFSSLSDDEDDIDEDEDLDDDLDDSDIDAGDDDDVSDDDIDDDLDFDLDEDDDDDDDLI